jgi:hypothetical protein
VNFWILISVIGLENFNLFTIVVSIIPKLSLLVVSNMYFAGVLFLKFHFNVFKDLIVQAQRKISFRTTEKLTMMNNDLELCDLIDNMSVMHSKLFKIYRTFSGIFQFQMLIIIISNFFGLMIDMFYVFGVSFLTIVNLNSPKTFQLGVFAFVAIAIRCYDIYFHMKVSSTTTCADCLNQRLVASLNFYRHDERLKNCVRSFSL